MGLSLDIETCPGGYHFSVSMKSLCSSYRLIEGKVKRRLGIRGFEEKRSELFYGVLLGNSPIFGVFAMVKRGEVVVNCVVKLVG